MFMILRSLALNESTLVGSKTIIKDIEDYKDNDVKIRTTILEYIDCLDRLHLIEN